MLFYRHPLWLLCLFPVSDVLNVFFSRDAVTTGGFMLLPMDPVYFFTIVHLGLCTLLQPRKMAQALKENKVLTILLVLVAVYVVLWAPVYGFQRSLGEARKVYFMFLIPLLAAVAIKTTDDLRKFVLVLVWAAIAVTIFGLGRAAMQGSVFLALNSSGTIIIALVGFVMLVHRVYRIVIINPMVDRVLLCLSGLIVLVSGQRSVWLAVGFGLILMFWFYRSRSPVIARMLLVSAFAVFGLSAGVSIFPDTGSRLLEKFGGIVNPMEDDNASWRIKRWEYQRDRLIEQGNVLFGEGLGGYERDPLTGELAPSAHNAYVQTVLKLGVFGLTIYALLAFQFFRKTLAVRKNLAPGPLRAYIEAGILSFGAAHAYIVGYNFMPIMLMIFSVAVCAVKLSQKQRVGNRNPHPQYIPNYGGTYATPLNARRPLRTLG
jgi:hypothetical protein